MSLIRKATKEDIDWIVDIAIKDMFSLIGFTKGYNPSYLKNKLIPYLIDKGIVLVIKDYAVIVGSINQHPFNPNILTATEFMWWVREDKRNGSYGYKLLMKFEEIAKKKNVDFIALSLISSNNIKSLEKKGYRLNEFSFLKEV